MNRIPSSFMGLPRRRLLGSCQLNTCPSHSRSSPRSLPCSSMMVPLRSGHTILGHLTSSPLLECLRCPSRLHTTRTFLQECGELSFHNNNNNNNNNNSNNNNSNNNNSNNTCSITYSYIAFTPASTLLYKPFLYRAHRGEPVPLTNLTSPSTTPNLRRGISSSVQKYHRNQYQHFTNNLNDINNLFPLHLSNSKTHTYHIVTISHII